MAKFPPPTNESAGPPVSEPVVRRRKRTMEEIEAAHVKRKAAEEAREAKLEQNRRTRKLRHLMGLRRKP